LNLAPFNELKNFNHREGKAGNIPKALIEALHSFYKIQKPKAKELAITLCMEVTNHYQKLWRDRCKALYQPNLWSQAQEKAKTTLAQKNR
jgi:hypothetical protein